MFIFEVHFVLKTTNVCLLFLELKLSAKPGPSNEKNYLFIFIKFIKKLKKEKKRNCRWEKMSKAIEENKLKVTIKTLWWEFNLDWELICTDKNNHKNKTNFLLPLPLQSQFS